jgi:uncharacterized OB-fold protein
MCYACTQCGKCGKFGEGENLASMIRIPCLKCGAVVNPFNGICTECGHQAFIVAGTRAAAVSSVGNDRRGKS